MYCCNHLVFLFVFNLYRHLSILLVFSKTTCGFAFSFTVIYSTNFLSLISPFLGHILFLFGIWVCFLIGTCCYIHQESKIYPNSNENKKLFINTYSPKIISQNFSDKFCKGGDKWFTYVSTGMDWNVPPTPCQFLSWSPNLQWQSIKAGPLRKLWRLKKVIMVGP